MLAPSLATVSEKNGIPLDRPRMDPANPKAVNANAQRGVVKKAVDRAVKILNGQIETVDEFLLEDAKRSIVLVKKIGKTDKKYPRGNGKERKKPL